MSNCPICFHEPSSHSFYVINNIKNMNVIYSCPAKATKYFESSGVLEHIDIVLKNIYTSPWIWIFDCDGFTLKHASQTSTSLGIADMITNKYGENLKKVWIINPTWGFNIVLNMMKPILGNKLSSLIEISHLNLDDLQKQYF